MNSVTNYDYHTYDTNNNYIIPYQYHPVERSCCDYIINLFSKCFELPDDYTRK